MREFSDEEDNKYEVSTHFHSFTLFQERQIEEKIHRKRNTKVYDPKYEAIYRDIEDSFTGYFGTKVKVNAGKRSGKIVIEYKTNDDLERILGLIK